MPIGRREFLAGAGMAAAGSALTLSRRTPAVSEASAAVGAGGPTNGDEWAEVRQQFRLSDEFIHLSALLIASNPAPVRDAIAGYRDELDADPLLTVVQHNRARQRNAREAAACYLGVQADDIALTDSTTLGLALVYNGLRLRKGQEILTTEQDYYVTHEAVRQVAARTGAAVRQIPLYAAMGGVSPDGLVDTIRRAIRPVTRVVALTWVHSSTGLKLPLAALGEAVREVNARRDDGDAVLLSIDGVHGFGIEDVQLADLGIDFFAAGCHKWLFGPRGTGILWATSRGWAATEPLVPSFTDDGSWRAWLEGDEVEGPTTASRMTPGGFKAFEHQWAMDTAFEFHQRIGKSKVEQRTHELARQLKEGLERMPHVALVTPMDESLSAGIVCFDVDGQSPADVVHYLRDRKITASVTPYAVRHARLTPSIRNTPEEIETVLEAIASLT